MDSKGLPEDLRQFIDGTHWIFAKTWPQWPHEYIVRWQVDQEKFVKLYDFIKTEGSAGRFYKRCRKYYKYDGRLYWAMGHVVNRCKIEDSYEYRLKNGLL